MLASLGKPVVVIGSDSRARMIELLGLTSYFVNDVPDADELFSHLMSIENDFSSHMNTIRYRARDRYIELIRPHLVKLLSG